MADEWLSLTHALTQTMRSHAPGWTDDNDSDPGITMLELIAYLAESLRLHATSSEKISSAAIRAIRALEAVADREPVAVFVTERWSGTTRPNYFFGKVLGVEDFREEQQYHVGKLRRHLQTLHGSGVARGLDVSVSSDGTSMTVAAGVAIDASGHEIVLDDPVLCVRSGASAIVALSKRSRREAMAAEYRLRSVLTDRAYACSETTLTRGAALYKTGGRQ